MSRHVVLAVLMAALLVLAGCSSGLSTPTDQPLRPGSDAGQGAVNFYISDEQNAIDDFQSLDVTISRIGFKQAGENESWIERDVGNLTVDLTRLHGTNATLLTSERVPQGNYTTVFAHVTAINGTLTTGESANVKLPSEKLQLHTPFSVADNETVDFVFDITVIKAGNSGKYILKPVIDESGTSVPFTDVDEDEADDHDDEADDESLALSAVGTVAPGQNVTLEVTRNGSAVENATIWLDNERLGGTDVDGRLTVAVPGAIEEFEVTAVSGDTEAELEVEFDDEQSDDDDAERDESDRDDDRGKSASLDVAVIAVSESDENATIRVTRNDDPVANASVEMDGEIIGQTGADGQLTIPVPQGTEEFELSIGHGTVDEVLTVDVEIEIEIDDDSD